MACPKKTKQLTLLDFHSKKLKLAEAEDDSESHSDLEVEDESLGEQDFSVMCLWMMLLQSFLMWMGIKEFYCTKYTTLLILMN